MAKHTNAPRRSRRATIMSQQSNTIVAQPSSSARALKRSAIPRGREMAAKKAKGIEKKLPWSRLDRRETRVYRDEDGEHKKVPISRQRALLKAGASHAAREAARSDAFGGSVEVQRAHESAARGVASGGGNQETFRQFQENFTKVSQNLMLTWHLNFTKFHEISKKSRLWFQLTCHNTHTHARGQKQP